MLVSFTYSATLIQACKWNVILICSLIIAPLSPLYFVFPPQVHACLEMVFLLFFAVDATFQLLWLRPRTFFTNKRSLIKVVILVVLFTDAFVVVCRGVVHVRVLRCLRPYYFIDCYVTSGVRRSVEAGRGRLDLPFSQWGICTSTYVCTYVCTYAHVLDLSSGCVTCCIKKWQATIMRGDYIVVVMVLVHSSLAQLTVCYG